METISTELLFYKYYVLKHNLLSDHSRLYLRHIHRTEQRLCRHEHEQAVHLGTHLLICLMLSVIHIIEHIVAIRVGHKVYAEIKRLTVNTCQVVAL